MKTQISKSKTDISLPIEIESNLLQFKPIIDGNFPRFSGTPKRGNDIARSPYVNKL